MNLKDAAAAETAVLKLLGADNRPMMDGQTQVSLTMYGPGTDQFVKAQGAKHKKALQRIRQKGKAPATATELLDDNAEFMASCVADSTCFEYEGLTGKEMYKAAFLDPSIGFVAEQVSEFLGEWTNFTKGALAS